MKATELRAKSLSGAKWTLIASGVTLPLAYLTTVFLARISPEVLGIYAAVNIFIGFLVAFVLLGGNVFAVLLPELDKKTTLNFLYTYCILELILLVAFLSLQYIIPDWWASVVPEEFYRIPTGIIWLLSLLVIGVTVLIYILRGMMEITLSSFLERGILLIVSLLLISFAIIIPSKFVSGAILLVGAAFTVAYFVVGVFAMRRLRSYFKGVKISFGWFLPNGFWQYATFVHFSTISAFLYTNLDRVFLLGRFDVELLGIYYGTVQLAAYTRLLPVTLSSVLLPTVSNALKMDSSDLFPRLYDRSAKLLVASTTVLSLGVIFFSSILMAVYGESFVPYRQVLILLAAAFGTGSLGRLNASVLLADKRSRIYFVNSIIIVAIQFGILIFATTILEIATAKALSLVSGQILSMFLVKYTHKELSVFPPSYRASVLIIVSSALIASFVTLDLFASIAGYLASLLFVFYLGKYTIEDVRWLKQAVYAR